VIRSDVTSFSKGESMAVARVTEVTASSTEGFDRAVKEGLTRAAKTLRGITGLEVVSMKAKVADGNITEFRATMRITFILEE
jgi:flavin-binding protein dodecin